MMPRNLMDQLSIAVFAKKPPLGRISDGFSENAHK
jgi:hypothetical protein